MINKVEKQERLKKSHKTIRGIIDTLNKCVTFSCRLSIANEETSAAHDNAKCCRRARCFTNIAVNRGFSTCT